MTAAPVACKRTAPRLVRAIAEGVKMVDLDLDLDAGEAAASQLRMQAAGIIPEGDEADDEDM